MMSIESKKKQLANLNNSVSPTGPFLAHTRKEREFMNRLIAQISTIEHLQWIYDRMVYVHGENPNFDYMLRLKKIIDKEI